MADRLLDRFADIGRKDTDWERNRQYFEERSPLSRNAYGGEAGYQYRRQEEAYGRALRLLSREARRGDVNSALGEIRVREEAMARGFTPGGIRDRRAFNAEREGWQASMAEAAGDAALGRELNRRWMREELDGPRGMQESQPWGGRSLDDYGTSYDPPGFGRRGLGDYENDPRSRYGAGMVNPNSTMGAGRGEGIGRYRSPESRRGVPLLGQEEEEMAYSSPGYDRRRVFDRRNY